MKSRYLLIALLTGGFFLIIFGPSIIQAPEVIAIDSAAQNSSTIDATGTYTTYTYMPLLLGGGKPLPTLFYDNFSDPASGWLIGVGQHITLSYQSGEFDIEIFEKWWWGASAPQLVDISNYTVISEARLHSGSVGMYGVIFDRKNWDNYYVFIVNPSNQLYSVHRYDNQNWVDVIPFTPSPAINAGSATNILKVSREGDKITVYVNNQLLATANDNTFTGTINEVGLFAQTLDDESINARFDNFFVQQIIGTSSSTLSQNTNLPNESTIPGGNGILLQR